MHAFIINLAEEKCRRAFQERQMRRLGLDFTFTVAVPAAGLAAGERARYWGSWQRPLRLTERACLLSHLDLWRRIARGASPVLVLEDDALLAEGVAQVLAGIETLSGVDHVSLETRGRRKLVARAPMMRAGEVRLRRLYQDRSGAAAYVLFPSGARRLIGAVERRAGLSDAVICATRGLTSYQVDPAMAIQLDQCEGLGIEPPLQTVSAIDREPRAKRKTFAQTRRRIAAQLCMLVRRVAVLGRAESRLIQPSAAFGCGFQTPEWPCPTEAQNRWLAAVQS
ncbi:MAG: glycosyltransferase family 25 protein [Cereibacter changlensis]|uniref:glycosyltransferase family 25 protein n=1 Tax=Cereibacter changlensis TaxID=402884 RepID=UPI001475FDB4|nr:glycosyltransferase family 25 protein [Cereibacter changlensis]